MENILKPNKLTSSSSPYLRQHANNPVQWHPWGEEALSLAKKENKPIFLSIGYSTCHWCHVMAHESFENAKIAALMNERFINIKVDREERPDVDALYMTAVQALTSAGGWPMSVWLTPDLKPFYAGTYFPPEDRYGRPGFPAVLTQLSDYWNNEREKVLTSADQITDLLQQYALNRGGGPGSEVDVAAATAATFNTITAMFDPNEGGFSPAPKFPMPVYMEFLLDHYGRTKNADALRMVAFTMEKIASGGIYDHLGGGFARYSTDARWVVPHFEKMLYDNAQLLSVSARLYAVTGDARWKTLSEHGIGYVLKDLRHPDGGFFSAEDADSEGKEGTFYLWTVHEVKELLTPVEAEQFIAAYGLSVEGNFMDPHTRETGKNVLVRISDQAKSEALVKAEQKLLEARARRPRPHRDEKILTEWNGLMISALAKAGTALQYAPYVEQAKKTAEFIKTRLFDESNAQLFRSWCDGKRSIPAQQSDYAMLIQGVLDLGWNDWARQLQETHDRLFFDEELGGYFMNVARPDLLIRMKDDNDNVIPSGNSVAVRNGLRLAKLTGKTHFADRAQKTVHAFAGKLKTNPASMAAMVSALADSCATPRI